MIAHVILFRPRPDLLPGDREALAAAIERGLREIPSIRRFRLGRRVRHGAGYEGGMSEDLEFAAIIEFDDLAGLQAYLAHPSHADLGARFTSSMASGVIYDYELVEAREVRSLLGGGR